MKYLLTSKGLITCLQVKLFCWPRLKGFSHFMTCFFALKGSSIVSRSNYWLKGILQLMTCLFALPGLIKCFQVKLLCRFYTFHAVFIQVKLLFQPWLKGLGISLTCINTCCIGKLLKIEKIKAGEEETDQLKYL